MLTATGRLGSTARQGPTKNPTWKFSLYGISVAIYLTLFQSVPLIGQGFSFIAVALLLTVGIFTVAQPRASRLSLNTFDAWAAVIVILSISAFFNQQNETSAYFTIIFALACVAISLISKTLPLEKTLLAFAVAHGAMTATALIVYPMDILTSLNPASAMRWSLRVRPFNLHPNLVGFMFSGGAILQLYAAAVSKSRPMRFLYILLCVSSLVIAVAASARAGLLAFFMSLVVVGVLYARKLFQFYPNASLGVLSGGLLFALLLSPQIVSYATVVFELDSRTRGLSSGGSGRIDRWLDSIEFWTRGNVFIGSGLRTVGVESVGFASTENSYLNIAIENGVIGLAATLVLIALTLVALARNTEKRTKVSGFSVWMVLYALIQSMFNRYLVAIGNDISLTFLLIVAAASAVNGRARIDHSRRKSSAQSRPEG